MQTFKWEICFACQERKTYKCVFCAEVMHQAAEGFKTGSRRAGSFSPMARALEQLTTEVPGPYLHDNEKYNSWRATDEYLNYCCPEFVALTRDKEAACSSGGDPGRASPCTLVVVCSTVDHTQMKARTAVRFIPIRCHLLRVINFSMQNVAG